MKFLCDVHISIKFVKFLNSVGFESVHINDILDGCYSKDKDICHYADQHDYVVITKDADFKNSHLIQGSPKKLIKINLGNLLTSDLIDIINANQKFIQKAQDKSSFIIEISTNIITIHASD